MDGVSLVASVIAIIQLTGSSLKLFRKFLGPSEFSSSELTFMVTAIYGFNGALKTFQTHLEIYEDDEARLESLRYLHPVLFQCKEALNLMKTFFEKGSFVKKCLAGSRLDRKLKPSLKALHGAKDLFMLALHTDQQ